MKTDVRVLAYTAAEAPLTADIELPIQVVASDGTALPLVKDGSFGADVIRFSAGEGVNTHSHAGAHILFVIDGEGTVEYGDEDHPLRPGITYLVPEWQPHAIRAKTDLLLLAVGNDHQPPGSTERLVPLPDRQTGEVASLTQ